MRSRSVLTALMRRDMSSFCNMGRNASSTVVAHPSETSSVARKFGSPSLARIWSIMAGRSSEVEVDHLLHHRPADRHPAKTDDGDDAAVARGEEQDHIFGRRH